MDLLDEMKASLPLYAYPTSVMHETLRKLKVPINAKLEITDVMDSGDAAGGITGGMTFGDQALWVSLTHLNFTDNSPLTQKIKDYQNKRINRLQTEALVRDMFVGRNDPCPCGSGKKYKKCCGS